MRWILNCLRFLLCFVIFAVTLPVSVHAHAVTPPLIGTLNGEQPIRLQSLRIAADISGGMAETTVQMTFFNPNNRPLEGNLQFPLLAGQTVTGFALDINDKMRAAVPVEKSKGRQVFEEVERRRVDPALLEVTQGNNFKLRIFPVPARGTRTVELKYAETLTRRGQNWNYQLPLAYSDKLQNFDLTIAVNGADSMPQTASMGMQIQFAQTDNAYHATVTKTDFTSSGSLDVLIPASTAPKTFVQVRDGITYFLAEVPVPASRSLRELPKTIGLLWDSSGSGANRQHEAELAELDIYFKAVGNAKVRLTRLRDRPEATEIFTIRNGDWGSLRAALRSTVYDGASALADWRPESAVEEYLLFSDGLVNYGRFEFPTLKKQQRLYALNSSPSADNSRLAALAERSGGRLIQVNAHAPGSAAQELLTEGAHLVDLDAIGASALEMESRDPLEGVMRIAGKLDNPSADLTLRIAHDDKFQEIHLPITADAPAHPLAAHFWASYRLRAMEANPELQRAEIRRIGQEFAIPTSETSLIVLDTVNDYVRYDIVPPPELLKEFNNLRNVNYVQRTQQRDSHLSNVIRQFEQKLAWWEKSYLKTNSVEPPVKVTGAYSSNPVPVPARSALSIVPPTIAPVPPTFRPAVGSQTNEDRAVQRVEITGNAIRRVDAETPSPVQVVVAQERSDSAPVANFFDANDQQNQDFKKVGPSVHAVGVTLKRWSSDAPYITRMKGASADAIYDIYLDEKPSYLNSSAFYLDAADLLFEKGKRDLALRVLSNLAEMDLENRQILRILGYRLMEAGAPDLAIPIFEKVQRLAEDEPQSFRDLGLAFAAAKRDQEAIDQLNEVVMRSWDGRFPDIELISLAELNAIVARQSLHHHLDTSKIDPRLLKNMALDLRVVMTWDADASDMDLWVTDPNGEKCFYGHRLTMQGGVMSRDVTQGYGPEEFSLRNAAPGKYKIEANFYGNRQQVIAGATTLQVVLTTGFGTSHSKDQMVTLRLRDRGDTVFVGEFDVRP